MEMPPRDALVPLLKLAGTATLAAVAYRYGSKYAVAAARRKHGRRPSAASTPKSANEDDAKEPRSDAAEHHALDKTAVDAPANGQTEAAQPTAAPPSPQSLAVAMLLQDSYLLVSVFGAFMMVLTVLTALAVVALNDNVASLDDLHMFAPLMCVGMALISVGMLRSMLQSPPKARRTAAPAVQRCPFSGAVASMPLPRSKAASDESETQQDEEDTAPRVSRCPFGFG